MCKKIIIATLICLFAFLCCKGSFSLEKARAKRLPEYEKLSEEEKLENTIDSYGFDPRPLLSNWKTAVYIPEVDIAVPLQWISLNYDDSKGQNLTDQENLGIIFSDFNNAVIADHAGQNFKNLSEVKEGMNAYMNTSTEDQTTLKCIFAGTGKNKEETGITDQYGTRIRNLYKNKVIMYTCQGADTKHIVLTVWEFCDEDIESRCFVSGQK